MTLFCFEAIISEAADSFKAQTDMQDMQSGQTVREDEFELSSP